MDIYSEVTARIMEQMEQGVIPWQKPWVACGKAISRTTGKPYSLLNQMLLGRPGEYLTFKQCQEAGGKVRKGEKSQMVVFWKWIETEDEETGEKNSKYNTVTRLREANLKALKNKKEATPYDYFHSHRPLPPSPRRLPFLPDCRRQHFLS